jgi:hypothetical protein
MLTQTATIVDRNGYSIDDDVVPDGGALRVPMPFMDALGEATRRVARGDAALPPVYDGLGNPAGHRAGFVFGPDELTADAAAAYAEFKARLADAWRQPASLRRSHERRC